jgi:hypothetical protein
MCAGYNHCLDKAIDKGWAGFSCRMCCAFEPLELSRREWLRREWLADSLACRALMHVTELPDGFVGSPGGSIIMRLRHTRLQRNGWASN